MESEIVKEIKEALRCCIKLNNTRYSDRERQQACISCPYSNKDECDVIICKNCLKLIKELEREKEKWQKKAVYYYQRAKSYGVECIVDNDIVEVEEWKKNETNC